MSTYPSFKTIENIILEFRGRGIGKILAKAGLEFIVNEGREIKKFILKNRSLFIWYLQNMLFYSNLLKFIDRLPGSFPFLFLILSSFMPHRYRIEILYRLYYWIFDTL